MIAAIFNAIAALPELFSYLEKFSIWLTEQISAIKKRKALEDAQKAIDQSKATKDTSGIDKMFRGE